MYYLSANKNLMQFVPLSLQITLQHLYTSYSIFSTTKGDLTKLPYISPHITATFSYLYFMPR